MIRKHKKVEMCVASVIFLFCHVGLSLAGLSDSDMYPHLESDGTSRYIFGDDGTTEVSFSTGSFNYFGRTFWSVFLSGNGIVTFDRALSSGWIWMESCDPRNVTQAVGNRSVIMPFWADVDSRLDDVGAKLLYKETQSPAILQKAAADINAAFPGGPTVTPSWAFIVTWKRLPQYGSRDRNAIPKRNTFQLVMVTGGGRSYIIFYYREITWYRHFDNSVAAAAGFVYNNGFSGYFIPGSCNKTDNYMMQLPEKSNIDQPGKWVFRVDTSSTVSSIAPVATPLISTRMLLTDRSTVTIRLEPRVIPVMGNVPILVHGLIADYGADVTCIFRDPGRPKAVEVKGIVIPQKAVICSAPFFNSLGKMRLSIAVTYPQRATTTYEENIYVVHQHEYGDLPQITFTQTMNSSKWLSAQWNPKYLDMEKIEQIDKTSQQAFSYVTPSPSLCEKAYHLVQIVLLEFDGKKWREVGPISPQIINNGAYLQTVDMSVLKKLVQGKVLPRTFAIKGQYNLTSGAGLVENMITSSIPISTDTLVVELEGNALIGGASKGRRQNENKFDRMCSNWYKSEHTPLSKGALPCPKTVKQASLDWRFMVDKTSELERFYPNVSVTYIQRVAASSGSTSQCAYDNDDLLMIDVGLLQKYSPNGGTNFWTHYWNDVMPFLYCCRWSFNHLFNCHNYAEKRPPNRGAKYDPPVPARAIGNGHITTFDGFTYTFNGAGEFWLVKYSEGNDDESHLVPNHFKMQIRMEKYTTFLGHQANVSLITAVVMEEAWNGNEVKIQVGHDNEQGFEGMIDGEVINLQQVWQDSSFKNEFTVVIQGVTISVRSQHSLSISFSSGFSFDFIAADAEQMGMHMVITASKKLMNKTEGLLGNFDGKMGNDLKSPGGPALALNSSAQKIHSNFGLKWMVPENQSIFTYPPGKSYRTFTNPRFQPVYFVPNEEPENINNLATSDCGDFRECIFDLIQTENAVIAFGTKAYFKLYEQVLNMSKKEVKECDEPLQPVNGYLVADSYVVKSRLEVKCFTGYILRGGGSRFICIDENDKEARPQWKVGKNGGILSQITLTCEPDGKGGGGAQQEPIMDSQTAEESGSSVASAFIVIIVLVIFIVVVVAVISEYPPCKPAKMFVLSQYRRYRQSYEINQDEASLNAESENA